MKTTLIFAYLALSLSQLSIAQNDLSATVPRTQVANGTLEGVNEQSGVRSFKGIPFAAPPVGELRWREPQPAKNWTGVRKAEKFGPRAMQRAIYGDMNFRSDGMSEDCLYLNVWTPAKTDKERLPVMVYFYGGGFNAGDGSEPRYDGESMARRGIVALTVNYRLGLFGFMAHPELTKESPNKASGNYGLMDQQAALRWVQQNIAAFGGDPKRVTIAGESAGSTSVSAQMVSPGSKNLIAGAIGESGSLFNTAPPVSLAEAEKGGETFASSVNARSLAELRAMPAEKLLEETAKPTTPRFNIIVDGYFLPNSIQAIFSAGQQAKVPLLAGWNSEEANGRSILGTDSPTPENFAKAVKKLYGDRAEQILKLYPGQTEAEIAQAATDLATDRGTGFRTWKWIDMHVKTGGGKPVYRYFYSRPRPPMRPEMGNVTAGTAGGIIRDSNAPRAPTPTGAVHSAEIEYALGNLATNRVFSWAQDDYRVSETMQAYFANFIKTGNPNSPGLPNWPAVAPSGPVQVMHIDLITRVETDRSHERYQFLNSLNK